ncbi:hypothetical protein [Cellulosimicrobium cellulans]|uniref:hypothetical protein n=1 Tax=Cellulosimicrobium cellulans TaxID=1710 RepID=UPI003C32AE5B
MPWKPGQRRAQRALEDPFADVPEHLHGPLWDWILAGLQKPTRVSLPGFGLKTVASPRDRYRNVALALRIDVDLDKGPWELAASCAADHAFMLDLVEVMLEQFGYDEGRARELQGLLTMANSAYRVRDDWGGLEERVAPGVKELVSETIDTATGSAGDHLANAWNEAYGRKPDPVKAYSESIKAAEAAFAPLVSPQNAKQTLGTMIRDIKAKPAKWKFVIAEANVSGVDTTLNMMQMLWDGQTSRHGGTGPTRDETPEEARAAVHLAAALVQLGVSKAFDVV